MLGEDFTTLMNNIKNDSLVIVSHLSCACPPRRGMCVVVLGWSTISRYQRNVLNEYIYIYIYIVIIVISLII